MKKTIVLITACLLAINVSAQRSIMAGMGYAGEKFSSPGMLLEFETEKRYATDFSLPLRGDLILQSTSDCYALSLDIHKGFRKYFRSGLFLEQSAGIGVTGKKYKTESFWFVDEWDGVVAHGQTTVWWLMPSVSAGIGYMLPGKNENTDLIWIRPKLYWNLGFRGLHLPYYMIQIGYSHTFKTI